MRRGAAPLASTWARDSKCLDACMRGRAVGKVPSGWRGALGCASHAAGAPARPQLPRSQPVSGRQSARARARARRRAHARRTLSGCTYRNAKLAPAVTSSCSSTRPSTLRTKPCRTSFACAARAARHARLPRHALARAWGRCCAPCLRERGRGCPCARAPCCSGSAAARPGAVRRCRAAAPADRRAAWAQTRAKRPTAGDCPPANPCYPTASRSTPGVHLPAVDQHRTAPLLQHSQTGLVICHTCGAARHRVC